MDYSNIRPVERERRALLVDAARDVASLAKQVIDTSPALNPGQRKALEALQAAALNARQALGGGQ